MLGNAKLDGSMCSVHMQGGTKTATSKVLARGRGAGIGRKSNRGVAQALPSELLPLFRRFP